MKEIFSNYGINLTESQINAFEIYYQTLIEYNKMFNITTITEREEVVKKHFIDSVLGSKYFEKGSLIDIGSGGGFPAIPLKIINDNLNVTMVEATGKKCYFLNQVINNLKLKNIKVINGRAEDLAKDSGYREKFDYCSARAVARLNTLCEYCMPFVKIGGRFISYKGDSKEEVLEAKNAINILGGSLQVVEDYLLDDAKRSFIVINKLTNTDKKYPRGKGKERKNPL